MNKSKYFDSAIKWVEQMPTYEFKASTEGFESPTAFYNRQTDRKIQPDISFVTHGGAKNYTEIALKSDKPRRTVTRWKLLSRMATLKRGKLYLLTPKGHKSFIRSLVNKYSINALIYSI